MRVEIMNDKLTSPRGEARLVGYWPQDSNDNRVPIYHVDTFHELNRLVGYAKFINSSNGTVLYRGQNKDYGQLIPSGARPKKEVVSSAVVERICQDDRLQKFFQLNNQDIVGWKEYQQVIIEAVIQHYGGNTYCMDFVDNHWCALWFGTYRFEDNHYVCRDDDDNNLYIYLYVADTNRAAVRGMFIGEDTYTVDLRKALPSTFQRPASQHGWIVRKKNDLQSDCNYNDNVVGVIEVKVKCAKTWLGNGFLLSEENFFPHYKIDQGYDVLLQRQYRSGLFSTHKKILPMKTICNYHLCDTYFCSDRGIEIKPIERLVANEKEICNIEQLYSIILNYGWKENSCNKKENWTEEEPWKHQSASTAILIYLYFGGDIFYRPYSDDLHYFNIINGVIIDLTYQELSSYQQDVRLFYKKKISKANVNRVMSKNSIHINSLLKNCKIKYKTPKLKSKKTAKNSL